MIEPNNYQPQFGGQPQMQQRYVTYIPYGYTPETFEERKKIRKIANLTGAALLVVLGISELFVLILQNILSIFNLWTSDVTEFVSDSAFNNIFNTIFSIIVFTIPFIVFFKIGKIRISGLIRFSLPNKSTILPYLFLGVGFCAIANITVSYMGSFFSAFGVDYNVDYGENPSGFFGFMLTFISTAVVPPLTEEFAFRGVVLGALKKYGNGFAIMTSAIIFGVVHGNFQQIPFAFLVGLILGFVTIKTGSIWLAVGIHAFNNAFSVFLDYIFISAPQEMKSVIYVIFLILSLLIGIIGVAFLSKKDELYSIKGKEPKAEKKKLYRWFFTSPTIIIFLILSLIQSLQFFIL